MLILRKNFHVYEKIYWQADNMTDKHICLNKKEVEVNIKCFETDFSTLNIVILQ